MNDREIPAELHKPYHDVIWDWNGTLFDDAGLCVAIMNELLARRGRPPLSAERYAEIFRFPVEAYYRDLPFDWSKESFEHVGREFMIFYELRKFECRLQDGALEALEWFRRLGAQQHLISGYRHDALEELVAQFGLAEWFSEIRGADDIYARGKVHLGEQWACGRESAGSWLVIGDTTHDFELARRIGADCILIAAGHNSRARLLTCGVPVFDSLREMVRILEEEHRRFT